MCQLFGSIQPATATCPSRAGLPFRHGRCETCNQRSQEQEISWARWHPPENLKNGGEPLLTLLFRIFTKCWNRRCLPDDFRDTNIITLYKNKGDRRDCNNYRGISLLCITGKVFARLLLPRVRQIADRILPESQCGFRPSRSTPDVVFLLRLL